MKISVRDGQATLTNEETLICGSDKTYIAEFEFDKFWNAYDKVVIFEAGSFIKSIKLTNNICIIPSECFKKAGLVLKIGIYGINDNYQTDTYWCHTSRILHERV